MKITDVKTYVCEGVRLNDRVANRWVLVQVETDEGVVGLGDATNWPGAEVVAKMIQTYKAVVLGESPFDIERLWKKLYRSFLPLGPGGVQVSALAGIETACWDIVGKVTQQPVYNLLGGKVHDRLRLFAVYRPQVVAQRRGEGPASGGPDPVLQAEAARWAVEQGYTAIKYSAKPQLETFRSRAYVARSAAAALAIRDAVGPHVDIQVDLGALWDVDSAIRHANAVAACDPLYMELHVPQNVDALVKINRAVRAPIGVGEFQFAREGFREVFERQAVEVINVDAVRTGGILETRKIAAMAEAYGVAVAPHNPNSPVSTLVSLHASIGLHNFLILEFHAEDVPWRDEIIEPPLRIEQGYLLPPERPGLGAELNMRVLKKHLVDW